MADVCRVEQEVRCVIPFLSVFLLSITRCRTLTHALGDLLYLEILGQKMLVINSEEIAEELLDKRSQTYSDRPQVPMVTL